MPRFSVILPTANRKEWLPRAVDSVIAQTFQDWELVIYDNSPEPYYPSSPWQDRRVWYYHGKADGIADAGQRSLLLARGEIVVQLADDDTLPADTLEMSDSLFGRSQWLCGRTAIYLPDGTVHTHRGGDQESVDRTVSGEYWLGGAVHFRRETGLSVGGYDAEYDGAAAYLFFRRLIADAGPPVLTTHLMYQYLDWPGTDSRVRADNQAVQSSRIRRLFE